jgi:hypothetical protein
MTRLDDLWCPSVTLQNLSGKREQRGTLASGEVFQLFHAEVVVLGLAVLRSVEQKQIPQAMCPVDALVFGEISNPIAIASRVLGQDVLNGNYLVRIRYTRIIGDNRIKPKQDILAYWIYEVDLSPESFQGLFPFVV